MIRNEYVIESLGAADKKYLRQYLEVCSEGFSFPCKISIKNKYMVKEYYVEISNVKDQGYFIVDWSLLYKG